MTENNISETVETGIRERGSSPRRPLFVRLTSLLLVVCMLVGDPAWAAGISDFYRSNVSTNLRDLSIPSRFGVITDRWAPPVMADGGTGGQGDKEKQQSFSPRRPVSHSPRRPLVVLVQDLHANVGVQKNIAGILEHLYNRFDVSSFYSEAAFGPCEVSVFRTLPSRRAQTKMINYLLPKALLSGADIAAMRVGHGALSPVKFEGVDDPLLYFANVQAFRDLVAGGSQVAREWKSTKELLMPGAAPALRRHLELSEKLLSLKLVDHEWVQYKSGKAWTPQGSPAFRTAVAAAERFYTAAEARNGAMAANLLAQIGQYDDGETGRRGDGETGQDDTAVAPRPPVSPSPHHAVALVTGGFHTASIAHILKQNQVPFVVVTPVVQRLDHEALYVRSLTEPPHETVAPLDVAQKVPGLQPVLAIQPPSMRKIFVTRGLAATHVAARKFRSGWRHAGTGVSPVLTVLSKIIDRIKALLASLRRLVQRPSRRAQIRTLTATVDVLTEKLKASTEKLEASAEELKTSNEKNKAAGLDFLTQIPNRSIFGPELEKQTRLAGDQGHDLSLIAIDLDGFKGVNDSYGHAEGDKVLVVLADILQLIVHEEAIVARGRSRAERRSPVNANRSDRRQIPETVQQAWTAGRNGGDEFLLLLPHASLGRAAEVAENIRVRFAAVAKTMGRDVSVSLGVAQLAKDETAGEFLGRADQAAIDSKLKGKNQVTIAPTPAAGRLRSIGFRAVSIIAALAGLAASATRSAAETLNPVNFTLDGSTTRALQGLVEYTVKKGDTLWGIAQQPGVSASSDLLQAVNGVTDPRLLQIGHKLFVPVKPAIDSVLPALKPGAIPAPTVPEGSFFQPLTDFVGGAYHQAAGFLTQLPDAWVIVGGVVIGAAVISIVLALIRRRVLRLKPATAAARETPSSKARATETPAAKPSAPPAPVTVKAEPVKASAGKLEKTPGPRTQKTKIKALMSQAEKSRAAGRIPQAIENYTEVLNLNPDHGQAYLKRGLLYVNQRQWLKAQWDLLRALELGLTRGEVQAARGALERIDAEAALYRQRAQVFASQGDLDQALVEIAHAIELNPRKFEYAQFRKTLEKTQVKNQAVPEALDQPAPRNVKKPAAQSIFRTAIQVWNDQRQARRRLKVMEHIWQGVQDDVSFASKDEAAKMIASMKKLLDRKRGAMQRTGNYARGNDWLEFGQRIGKAEIVPSDDGKRWIIREKPSALAQFISPLAAPRAPPAPTVVPVKPSARRLRIALFKVAATLLLVPNVLFALTGSLTSELFSKDHALPRATKSAMTDLVKPARHLADAPRWLAQATVAAVQGAAQDQSPLMPATIGGVRDQDGIPAESTNDINWGRVRMFWETAEKLAAAQARASASDKVLAVQLPMVPIRDALPTDTAKPAQSLKPPVQRDITDLEAILQLEREKKLRFYQYPSMKERGDQFGRGAPVDERDVKEFEERGEALQIWVEEDGNQYLLVFGTNMADRLLRMTQSYQSGRELLKKVLERTGTAKAVPMVDPKGSGVIAGIPAGAVVSSDEFRQPERDVAYFNKDHFVFQPAQEEPVESETQKPPQKWMFLKTHEGVFEAGFYSFDPARPGKLQHLSGDRLRGTTAEKILLKHVRNGKPLSKDDPLYAQPEYWDELVFGNNAGRKDFAEAMTGWANQIANVKNAKKNARLSVIGLGVSVATVGLDLGGGIANKVAEKLLPGAITHLVAASINAGFAVGSAFYGVPEIVDEKGVDAFLTEFLRKGHPEWEAEELASETKELMGFVLANPELRNIFSTSRKSKNEYVLKAFLQVASTITRVVAAGQGVKYAKEQDAARAELNRFIDKDSPEVIIDLSPEKWQDVLSQLTPAQRARFVELMGPVFSADPSAPRDQPFDTAHFDRGLSDQDMNAILVRLATMTPEQRAEFLGTAKEPGMLIRLTRTEQMFRAEMKELKINVANVLVIAGDPANAEGLKALFPGIDFSLFANPLELLKNGALPYKVQVELEKLVAAYGRMSADLQKQAYDQYLGKPTSNEITLRTQVPDTINLSSLVLIAADPASRQRLEALFPKIDFSIFQQGIELLSAGKLPYEAQLELEKFVAAFGELDESQQRQLYNNLLGKLTPQEQGIRNQLKKLNLDFGKWARHLSPRSANAARLDAIFADAVNTGVLKPSQRPDINKLPSQVEKLQQALGIMQAKGSPRFREALGIVNRDSATVGSSVDVRRGLELSYELVVLESVVGNLGGVGPYEDFRKTAGIEIELIDLEDVIGNLGGVGALEDFKTTGAIQDVINSLPSAARGVIASPENFTKVSGLAFGVDTLMRRDSLENNLNQFPLKLSGDIDLLRLLGIAINGQDSKLGMPLDFLDPNGNNWYQAIGFTTNIFSVINTLTDALGRAPIFPNTPTLKSADAYNIYLGGFPVQAIARMLSAMEYAKVLENAEYIVIRDNIWTKQLFWPRLNLETLTEAQFLNVDLEPIASQTYDAEGKLIEGRLPYFRDRRTGDTIIFGLKAFEKRARLLEQNLRRSVESHLVQTEGGKMKLRQFDREGMVQFAPNAGNVKSEARDFATNSINAAEPMTAVDAAPGVNALPGLTPSYRGRSSPDDRDKHTANPYDIGVAAILKAETGSPDAAYDSLRNLLNRRYAQRQLRVGDRKSPYGVINGLRTDLEAGGVTDGSVSPGPNAEIVMALLRTRNRQQDPAKRQWLLDEAVSIGRFLVEGLQAQDGSIRHGLDDEAKDVVSNEENLRALAALRMLADVAASLAPPRDTTVELFGPRNTPRIRPQKTDRYAGDRKVFASAAQRIVGYLKTQYDAEQGYLIQGSAKGVPTKTFATDVNALALMGVGPAELDQWFGAGTADKISKSLSLSEVTLAMGRPESVIHVTGSDFTDRAGRQQSENRQEVISPEMTGHVIIAHQVMAAYHLSQGRTAEARAEMDKAIELGRNLDKLTTKTKWGASLPYAVDAQGIAAGVLPFPDADHLTPAAPISEAGNIVAIAKLGVNPYRLDNDLRAALRAAGVPVNPTETTVDAPSPVRLSPAEKDRLKYASFEVGEKALVSYERLAQALDRNAEPGKKLLRRWSRDQNNTVYFDEATGEVVTVIPVATPKRIAADIDKRKAAKRDAELQAPLLEQGGAIVTYVENGKIVTRFLPGFERLTQLLDMLDKRTDEERRQIEENYWRFTAEFEGHPEANFILKFPPNKDIPRPRPNPITREVETHIYRNGMLQSTVTSATITKITNNAYGIESRSETYLNDGTRDAPKLGKLVFRTKTDRIIYSDVPANRRLVKTLTYPNGQMEQQIFSTHAMPDVVLALDEKGVPSGWQTRFVFDEESGALTSSSLAFEGTPVWTSKYRDPIPAGTMLSAEDLASLGMKADSPLMPSDLTAATGGNLTQYGDFLGRQVIRDLPLGYRSRVTEWNGNTPAKSVLLDPAGKAAQRYETTGKLDADGNSETRITPVNTVRGANGAMVEVAGKPTLAYYLKNDPLGRKAYEVRGPFRTTYEYAGPLSREIRELRQEYRVGSSYRLYSLTEIGASAPASGLPIPGPVLEAASGAIAPGTVLTSARTSYFDVSTPRPGPPYDQVTEYSRQFDALGIPVIKDLGVGRFAVVSEWQDGPARRTPGVSYVIDQDGTRLERYTPIGYNQNGTFDMRVETLATGITVIERRDGERVVSRSYLDPAGQVFRITYYAGNEVMSYPTYETDGAGKVLRRYDAMSVGSDTQIAGYAPDGTTLLEVLRRDRKGELLWQWDVLGHTLEIRQYDPITVNGVEVNRQGRHDILTRTEHRRLSPNQIGLGDGSLVNPYDPPTGGLSLAEQSSPAPAASSGVDPANIDLGGVSAGMHLWDTYHDSERLGSPPMVELNSMGQIETLMQVSDRDAQGNQRITLYRLPVPEAVPSATSPERMKALYQALLPVAQAATPVPEIRTIDRLGRLVQVDLGSYRTRHQYLGNTLQMLHSELESNGRKVWDVYYPGFQILDAALTQGINLDQVLASAGAVQPLTPEARAFITNAYAGAGFNRGTLPGFDSLPNAGPDTIQQDLTERGLARTTTLQSAVKVFASGAMSIDHRRPNDPAEEVILHDAGRSRILATRARGRNVLDAKEMTLANEVSGVYRTSEQKVAARIPVSQEIRVAYRAYIAKKLGTADGPRSVWSAILDFLKTLGTADGPRNLWYAILDFFNMYPLDSDAIWTDLSRVGINPETPLVDVQYTPRRLVQDAAGTVHYSMENSMAVQHMYVQPNDPLGRSAVRTNGIAGVNLWGWAEDTNNTVLSTRPPADILPANMAVESRLGELKLYDRPGEVNGVKGHWYRFENSNYKRREFWTNNGQPYVVEYAQVLTYVSQHTFRKNNTREFVYLDLSVGYYKPLFAVNNLGHTEMEKGNPRGAEAHRIKIWKDIKYLPNGVQEHIVDVLDPLRGIWKEARYYYDEHGDAVDQTIDYDRLFSGLNLPRWAAAASGSALFVMLSYGTLLAFLGALFAVSVFWGIYWKKFRRAPDALTDVFNAPKFGDAFEESLALAALERIRRNVLTVDTPGAKPPMTTGQPHPTQRDKNHNQFTADGNPETAFSAALFPLYAMVFKHRGITDPASHDQVLENLDRFAVGVGRHVAEEVARGYKFPGVARYAKAGAVDPHAWEKAFSYVHQLAGLIQHEFATQTDPAQRNRNISALLTKYGIPVTGVGDFNRDHFKAFLRMEGWENPTYTIGDQIRRVFGLYTKAIHPMVLDVIDLLPLFAIGIFYLGVMSSGKISNIFATFGVDSFLIGSLAVSMPLLLKLFAAGIVGGIGVEWWHATRLRFIGQGVSKGAWVGKITRNLAGVVWLLVAAAAFYIPADNLGVGALKIGMAAIALLESYGYLASRHSIVGLSAFYHLKPTVGVGRVRVVAIIVLQYLTSLGILYLGHVTFGWWWGHFESALTSNLFGALFIFMNAFYLVHVGTWHIWNAAFSAIAPDSGAPAKAVQPGETQIVINYIGPPLRSRGVGRGGEAVDVQEPWTDPKKAAPSPPIMTDLHHALDNRRLTAELTALQNAARSHGVKDVNSDLHKFLDQEVKAWLKLIMDKEKERGISLIHVDQLIDKKMADDPETEDLSFFNYTSSEEKLQMKWGMDILRAVTILMGSNETMDTAINLGDIAESLRNTPDLKGRVKLVISSNKLEDHTDGKTPATEPMDNNRSADQLCRLFTYISGAKASYTTRNWTTIALKGGGANGIFLLPAEEIRKIRFVHILDRNANNLQLPLLMEDYLRALTNDELVVLAARRDTANNMHDIGDSNRLIESGDTSRSSGINDKFGNGWESIVAVYFWHMMAAWSHGKYPILPLTQELQKHTGAGLAWRMYGLLGFIMNGIGQSEDLWGVWHQTSNLIGLGGRPHFGLTSSKSVKRRESYSSTSIQNAAGRWSRGLNQTRMSYINQIIGPLGPESIFERKARANVERFYVAAPFALLNILLFYPAIILDWMPFVGIQITFWIIALLFNQVLTLHGLIATARDSGVSKPLGWIGAGAAWIAAGVAYSAYGLHWGVVPLIVAAIPVGIFGFLFFGAPIGFSRWIANRPRDTILFAPRVVLEALAYVMDLIGTGYLFLKSGGREDTFTRSDTFSKLFGLKPDGPATPNGYTVPFAKDSLHVVLLVGAVASLFQLTAISVGFDFTNIILSWLSLYFVSGIVIGLFTRDNSSGRSWATIFGKRRNISIPAGWVGMAAGVAATWFIHKGLAPDLMGLAPDLNLWYLGAGIIGIPVLLFALKFLFGRNPNYPKTQHVLSRIQRMFWESMAAVVWFGVVQVPDVVRISIAPNQIIAISFWEAVFYFLAGGIILLSYIAFSKFVLEHGLRKRLSNQFLELAPAHYRDFIAQVGAADSASTPHSRTARFHAMLFNAAMMDFEIAYGKRSYTDAKKALETMRRYFPNLPVVASPTETVTPRKEDMPVVAKGRVAGKKRSVAYALDQLDRKINPETATPSDVNAWRAEFDSILNSPEAGQNIASLRPRSILNSIEKIRVKLTLAARTAQAPPEPPSDTKLLEGPAGLFLIMAVSILNPYAGVVAAGFGLWVLTTGRWEGIPAGALPKIRLLPAAIRRISSAA